MVTKIGAASGMITPDERSEKRAVRELVHCIKMQETTVLVNYDERESDVGRLLCFQASVTRVVPC
jgi:hypothetical protein